MIIRITSWGIGSYDDIKYDSDIGLLFAGDNSNYNYYKVSNKQLFMLAVLKYGIEFTEVQNALSRQKKMLTE